MAELIRTGTVLLVVALSGCAKLNSIYRSERVPEKEAHIVAIDAKQRAVISSPMETITTRNNLGETVKVKRRRFCAEPPPDVFSAYASSLGAKASLSNDATAKQIGAEFAATISENAATIERSQTVNVLRESMYRTCERYLSGAISEQEFIIQSARDQRAMVQVMAVEQLTGAARAQSTALITVAKAMAGGTTELSVKALETARKDVLGQREALEKLDTELASTDPKDKTCDALPAAPTDGTADPQKIKRERCAARAKSAATLKEAEQHYASLLKTVSNQSMVSSEASGELIAEAMRASTVSEALAKQVVQIVAINDAFDEVGMTCLALARSERLTDWQKDFVRYCSDPKVLSRLSRSQIDRETRALYGFTSLFSADGVVPKTLMLDAFYDDATSKIWSAISTSGTVDTNVLKALEAKVGAPLISIETGDVSKLTQDGLRSILIDIDVANTRKLLDALQ